MSILTFINIFILFFSSRAQLQSLSEDHIKSINEQNHSWKAGINWPKSITSEFLYNLGGSVDPKLYRHEYKGQEDKGLSKFRSSEDQKDHLKIPETFDARIHWPRCESIAKIRNQGSCSSCWAIIAAATITDRTCVASNGHIKYEYSASDILNCCGDECFENVSDRCGGGRADKAWEFWVKHGIVSGGDYQSKEGCKPYANKTFFQRFALPCIKQCTNKEYEGSYNDSKRFGNDSFTLWNPTAAEIQSEILLNGPLHGHMDVYEDFRLYAKGVYYHIKDAGDSLPPMGHSVKLIGWGIEEGVPYWLASNTWGLDWGQGGLFKIAKGRNECNIETSVFGGHVNLRSFPKDVKRTIKPKSSTKYSSTSSTKTQPRSDSTQLITYYYIIIIISICVPFILSAVVEWIH